MVELVVEHTVEIQIELDGRQLTYLHVEIEIEIDGRLLTFLQPY